ncbi:MAG TPA: FtsQ-type POTRA domain-containing protein [Candidatus Agrococcus pullicola]|uniref:FtsQ-type POTRA domain-containing protein n=1 Tax=Candidatus Agrococcus pullicola TaxID=2838429 RepID=A0A9D2C9A6_9MICO|nr:FtsQ-type POTRA domain-containing protein [Candidatus Agrococcus pullicola]
MRRPQYRTPARSVTERVDRELRDRSREEMEREAQLAREEQRELRRVAKERRRAERSDLRRFTAARRKRLRNWLVGFGVVAVSIGVLVALVTTPVMSVREIRVEGADRVSADEIREALQDQFGTPIALVSEEEVGERLSGFAALESYAVDLAPPSAIVIRVHERVPVALTEDGELVDAAGINLGEPRDGEGDLPTVVDVTIGGDTFASVSRVLVNLSPEMLARVETVTAESPQSISMTIDSGETVIWGGPEQSTLKSDTVQVLLASDAVNGRTIDVSAPEHPVVR